MRKLAVALLIVVASASYAEKVKSKSKEKRFEPVVAAASEYAGSYRGPSESHGLVLQLRGGMLIGNYVELGRVAVLHPIKLDGAEFTATASFDDGSWRTITGTFSNRVFNGRHSFGVRVRDVKVEGMGEVDTFFETLDP
ncbi:MAG TPA: hypothetical protein VNA69_20210 [Thermoanaerobaculia bacterium]|nr:hypothetical protein [Thermoanaerobaculia bacterium]